MLTSHWVLVCTVLPFFRVCRCCQYTQCLHFVSLICLLFYARARCQEVFSLPQALTFCLRSVISYFLTILWVRSNFTLWHALPALFKAVLFLSNAFVDFVVDCVHERVCEYGCACVCKWVWVGVCILCMCVPFVCVCMYTCMCVCMLYMGVCMCVCMLCICVCTLCCACVVSEYSLWCWSSCPTLSERDRVSYPLLCMWG